jgi:hypothetical protein
VNLSDAAGLAHQLPNLCFARRRRDFGAVRHVPGGFVFGAKLTLFPFRSTGLNGPVEPTGLRYFINSIFRVSTRVWPEGEAAPVTVIR